MSIARRNDLFFSTTSNGTPDGPPVQPSKAMEDLIAQRVWAPLFGPSGGNLTGETDARRVRYREILREPVVKAALLLKVWGVASLDWQSQPADPENERDKLVAEFNRDNIAGCQGGTRALVEAILFGAMIDGYGVCHKKKKVQERGKWAGKAMLHSLRPKDSAYFDLVFDEFLNIKWVKEKYPAENDPTKGYHDPSQFVIVRHLSIFDAPWGMSDFAAADRAYCCKDAAIKLRMIYLDKYIGPFLVGLYNGDEKAALDAALQAGRAGGWINIPKDSDVRVESLAMGGAEAFGSAISDFNEEMALGMTGSFLQMLAGQVPGGRGSSSEHASSAETFNWYLADLVVTTADDQITPEFTDENFAGSPPYPKNKLIGVNHTETLAELEIDQRLLEMKVPNSLTAVYARTGRIPPKDREDAVGGIYDAEDMKPQPLALDPFGPDGDDEEPAAVPAAAGDEDDE